MVFQLGTQVKNVDRILQKKIPFSPGVGDHIVMWNKIMKEVFEKWVAGPFPEIPFKNYIQSPIGLVPKDDNKTRLIFHLSYNFSDTNLSLNANTPCEDCTAKYNDLDCTIASCLHISGPNKASVKLSKTDLSSAFRMLPIRREHWKWLIFKAQNPITRETVFFVDKCLPFGASISCSHYQCFSNALKHIIEHMSGRNFMVTNYLDDFLFVETTEEKCNALVRHFLHLCEEICVPVAYNKTEWATDRLIFLGILLDGYNLML